MSIIPLCLNILKNAGVSRLFFFFLKSELSNFKSLTIMLNKNLPTFKCTFADHCGTSTPNVTPDLFASCSNNVHFVRPLNLSFLFINQSQYCK